MSKGNPSVTVRLDRDLKEWVTKYTKEAGRDKAEFIRSLIKDYRTDLEKRELT